MEEKQSNKIRERGKTRSYQIRQAGYKKIRDAGREQGKHIMN
jgi:hypothetical protein